MTTSMTGFAAARGAGVGYSWSWDVRSVNGKGLDLRLRVPDWIDGLEQALRADLQKAMSRGSINLTLKVARDVTTEATDALRLNEAALAATLAALARIEATATAAGVTLARPSAADVLSMRGVVDVSAADPDTASLRDAILAGLPAILADLTVMRQAEGAALGEVIAAQLDRIADLTRLATVEAAARRDSQTEALKDALAKVLEAVGGVDEARLAQELALIAVKTDVQEELDRLTAHVDAARALLAERGPVGRKFDFLMQEFMREANTLCSKAQALALTRIGLDLKTTIDQMREQVQNVE
ncbi:MAG: YicC/YloC family endoribonuclease [Tabrizicola sp.]|uniref:YicC/YloC family endoribonuclease n=1 Tax=Tabrizicola sp. TaxID=2005166 RepID=UPI002734A897|nr:YicC/YloC family endoribonuclease [Tabrizicola sp.]MDP3264444.1 YicC/YloC family endoribonuclease [Tabrizicola sp.]MDP3646490.1 YicC/YloC family endoribonuclease [Paracoccaceae bacterium]MDZ4065340.1 YicC/YloC family endoribonuclease [Tabrizicola sp.]